VAIVVLVILGVAAFCYAWVTRTPEVGGTFTLKATGDTRFYVYAIKMGDGQVSFSLRQLFGDVFRDPIAVEFKDGLPELAEVVCGKGAQTLHSESIGGLGGAGVNFTGESILARRGDGSLDQVFVFIFDWTPPNEPARRFLLPVRLRQGAGPSKTWFAQTGSSCIGTGNPTYLRILGHPAKESTMIFDFSPGSPPNKFAEEIQTKGLWEPESK